MKDDYTRINSVTWDQWHEEKNDWCIPVTHEEYQAACHGDWDVYLTPCIKVPHDWFGEMKNKRILGLASGGAQQMPIFAALGARCTVFDYSDKQLEAEQITAEREGYDIEIMKGDMTKKLPFQDESFDVIFHPVSNCYVEDVFHVWNECYRLLRKGGELLAGFDNGINFLFEDDNPLLVEQTAF